jgi:hypothetical protein
VRVILEGSERLWPSNRKPRPLDGCPTFAPSVRGPKMTGEAHQTISLCAKPLERSPKKLPPKRKLLKGTGFSPYINASIQVRL